MSFTIGSLFDGSGGFPLAAFMCGGTPVWASEIEPYPIAVTRSRFPHVKHLGSVTDIRGDQIDPVDVISFGSPCQDLSVAGKRAGLKHEDNGDDKTTRSGLFMEAVRIIKEMRRATNGVYPRIALWENVPGAFSSNRGEDFRLVLEELIKICEPNAVMPPVPKKGWPYADCYRGNGWSIAYRVFDAQYWGVPQRRRRIYLVVDFTGECAGEILFERNGLRGYFAEGRTPWQGTPADAQRGTGADDREGVGFDGYNGVLTGEVSATLGVNCGLSSGRNGVIVRGGRQLDDVSDILLDDQGGQQISVRTDGKAPTLRAETHGNIPCVMEPVLAVDQGAGKSSCSVLEDKTTTLAMNNDRYLFQPICVATQQGGAEITENGVCPTITAAAGMSGNNQPWICAKEQYLFENHSQDTRYRGPLDVCPIVSATFGMGGNNQPFVVEPYCKCSRAKSAEDATTWKSAKVANCLNTFDLGEVRANELVVEGYPAYSMKSIARNGNVLTEQANPICNSDYKDPDIVGYPAVTFAMRGCCVRVYYIVRRLTPTECARLQGFADRWATPDKKTEFSDEEYSFWLNVRNTHAVINGKKTKEYTRAQMLTWYNKLHTDSAEYKLWGNGIALPCALYVMQGITDVFAQNNGTSQLEMSIASD